MSKRPSPEQLVELEKQFRGIYRHAEAHFPFETFLDDARSTLASKSSEDRFPFVMFRIWMDFAGEAAADWLPDLAKHYDEFVEKFPWDECQLPRWVSSSLVERGLYHIQKRRTTNVKPRHVVQAVQQIGRLAARGIKP